MCGARSRSFAATRSTHTFGGSRMWSSTEISQSSEASVMPASWCSLELADRHVLDLLERADPVGAALAAEATLLVAAARGVRTEHGGVDVDGSRAQSARDLRRRAHVAPVHLRRQTVRAVVGD